MHVMSNAELSDTNSTDATDDVVVEEVTDVPPARRALEAGATFLAIGGFILALSQLLYIYTAYKLQTEGGQPAPGNAVLVRYMQVLTSQNGYMIVVLPLLAMLVVALIRAIWRNDGRAKDRVVIPTTLSFLIALFALAFSVYNAFETLIKGISGPSQNPSDMAAPVTGQLGEAGSAYLTTLTSHLVTLVLAIAVIALAALLAFGRNSYRGATSSPETAWKSYDQDRDADTSVGSVNSETPVADSTTTTGSVGDAGSTDKTSAADAPHYNGDTKS